MRKTLKPLYIIILFMLTSFGLKAMEEEEPGGGWPAAGAAAPAAIPGNMIVRRDFFKDIVGMDEDTFRKTYRWENGKLQNMLGPDFNLENWTNEYPRRKAISQGAFHFYPIATLDSTIGINPRPLTPNPSFEIRIHDPKNPQLTDIRALQADPRNKNAAFQIASTFFGPLEGGMIPWSAKLTDMLPRAVQGEEACVSAAGATIWRKYFMPTFEPPAAASSFPGYYYLLEQLKPKIKALKIRDRFVIDNNTVKRYVYDPNDIKQVGIGLHDNVYVTSGYAPTRIGRSATDRRPSPNDQQPQIPFDQNQMVAQIFTSAYSLIDVRRQNPNLRDSDPEAQFAQMILEASYEGTLKAAYAAGKPRVFLTLMGAGAFLNDIKWIGNALSKPEIIDFIQKTGMQVTIIYRPDPQKQPNRNANGDIAFLAQIQNMANAINGTADRVSDDVKRSIRNAYGVAAPVPAPGLRFERLLTLGNRETVGWLSVDGDAALINLGTNPAPTIDPATGAANFRYINPDVPSAVALPKGLYFWRSQNTNPTIGNRRLGTPVRHQPTTRDFRYTHPTGYLDQFGKLWDETRIRNPHPFAVPSAAALPVPVPMGGGFPAPVPASASDLSFERYSRNAFWLQVRDGEVLINLRGGETEPRYNPATGTANFFYINPDVPGTALPSGLYFWKSQNPNPEIGNWRSRTPMKNTPTSDTYRFFGGSYSGDRTRTPWDETGKPPHPLFK